MPAPIPAVAYYRMSTDRQEDSIDRQRCQVEPYAARHGYAIVRDYLDEGIAGDEEAKRKGFMRMLQDVKRGDFRAILCDDKDRFGRFDSITQGYYVKPLRDAGVKLVTVAQGVVDWSSFAGRITDAVLQEAKKLESQATSRRVITLMQMMAQRGKWLGGAPPYGYVTVPDPVLIKRLVPGDPVKVEAVRLMFHLYGERGFTLDGISAELFRRGIPNPRGGPTWNKTTIRAILGNRKYTGDMVWNAGHDGKYSSLVGGVVQTSDAKTPHHTNAAEDWIIIPDAHPALIDRALFTRVQAKLVYNRGKSSPLPNRGDYVFTGLLICGDCERHMIGSRQQGGLLYYKCGRYHQEGRHACFCNRIVEAKLLRCVVAKLERAILDPAGARRLAREMCRQEEGRDRLGTAQQDAARQRLAEMDRDIERGGRRLLAVDDDLVGEVSAQLRALKDERRRLAAELERAEAPPVAPDTEAVLREARRLVGRLREVLDEADPSDLRAVLQELVSKVELWFTHEERHSGGKPWTRTTFERGLIHRRPQLGEDANPLNAASPIPAAPGATRSGAPAAAPTRGGRPPGLGPCRAPGRGPAAGGPAAGPAPSAPRPGNRRPTPRRGRGRAARRRPRSGHG
jgi:site-specific DNA recombinase